MPPDSGSLAVIGGGVIGLSVARRAAQAGWSVRVHRSGLPGASWVAAGMLAPHSEGWPGEERLLQLGLDSLRLWRQGGFTDGLPAQVITARESLVVAVDRADVADLRTVADWLTAQGHPVAWESAVRDVEPMLAQGIRHGFRAPTELAVDNRALLEGLSAACEQLGVEWDGPVTDLASVARRHGRDRQRCRRSLVVARSADSAGERRSAEIALAQRVYAVAAAGNSRSRAWTSGIRGAPRRRCGRRRHPVRARPRHRAHGIRSAGSARRRVRGAASARRVRVRRVRRRSTPDDAG